MAKRKNIIQFTVQRREGQPLGGPLSIHHEVDTKEKLEAVASMLWATFAVAQAYDLKDHLVKVCRAVADEHAARQVASPSLPGGETAGVRK